MKIKSKIPVRDVMTSKVITVGPDATLVEAAKMMMKHDIGGVLVEKKGEPVGIITEKDFTIAISKGKNPASAKVKDVMSSSLITIGPEQSILDAAHLMTKKKIRKLPVKNKGRLVGIITAEDIIRVAPREIELLLELAAIKSGDVHEMVDEFRERDLTEGECDVCGNYSDRLRKTDNEEYICNDCYTEEETEEEK